jgi:SnoaL-like domain
VLTNLQSESGPTAVLERLRRVIDGHDLDALAACFDPDYHSEFPAHPDRTFRGHHQMRKNWSQIFGALPDIEAALRIGGGYGVGRVGMDWYAGRWRSVRPAGHDHPGCAPRSYLVGAPVYGAGARGWLRCRRRSPAEPGGEVNRMSSASIVPA